MSNKYKLTEENISYIGVAYKSFHIDHETREVIGLNEEDHPRLVDKWLKSGKIVKIESEEEISIETEEASEAEDTKAENTEAEEVDMEVEEEDVAVEKETAQPEDSQDPEEESSDHT